MILKPLEDVLRANQNLEKVEKRHEWTKFQQQTPPFKLKAVQDAMIKHMTVLNSMLQKNPADPECSVKLIIPLRNLFDNLSLPRDQKVISMFLTPLDTN